MPSTPLKNLLYRAALPFAAPNPHKQMKHLETGKPLQHLPYYEHLLVKHRVLVRRFCCLIVSNVHRCIPLCTALGMLLAKIRSTEWHPSQRWQPRW